MSGPLLELRVAARARELKGIREAVKRCVLDSGGDARCAQDAVLAVDEACQNVIRHAYGGSEEGEMVLTVERRGNELVFWLRDFAPRVDPARIRPRPLDELRPGGLGTFLIREVMDSAEFLDPPPDGGNLLRMVKRIA